MERMNVEMKRKTWLSTNSFHTTKIPKIMQKQTKHKTSKQH